MTQWRHLVPLALALCLAAGASIEAQERVFAFFGANGAPGRPNVLVELGTAPGELGVVKRVLQSPVDLAISSPVPVAGGRYLAFMKVVPETFGVLQLYFFDLRTAGVVYSGAQFLGGGILASDPRVPRLFIRHYVPDNKYGITVATLDPFSVTQLAYVFPPGGWPGEPLVDYSQGGPRLIVPSGEDMVDVVDLSTGQRVQTIQRSYQVGIAIDGAGTLYVGRGEVSSAYRLHAIDLATGGVKAIAQFTLPAFFKARNYELVFDETRRRLMVLASCFGCTVPEPIGVLNPDTLALEATVSQSMFADLGPVRSGQRNDLDLHVSGRSDAYFVGLARYYTGAPGGRDPECLHHSLTRVDANTGAVLERADLRPVLTLLNGWGCSAGQRIQINSPSRPTLSALAHGNTVTLSWNDPGNLTHFDLEAGSAPGLNDLLTTSLRGTSFTVAAVPAGTYYLRVRAINDVGRSLPSNEVQVVVRSGS
jgi:hypothetical protein